MRITTKGRYALRAAIALAETSAEDKPVTIKAVAEREGISPEFLEQIFFRLRRGGVIKSVRGPGGGFYLARPAAEISLLDILEASGESLGIAPCSCGRRAQSCSVEDCAAGGIWREMDNHLRSYAAKKNLKDMIAASQN